MGWLELIFAVILSPIVGLMLGKVFLAMNKDRIRNNSIKKINEQNKVFVNDGKSIFFKDFVNKELQKIENERLEKEELKRMAKEEKKKKGWFGRFRNGK